MMTIILYDNYIFNENRIFYKPVLISRAGNGLARVRQGGDAMITCGVGQYNTSGV